MKSKNAFGGSLLKKSNAKEKRPWSSKQAMHIVLRSSLARGSRSMLKAKNKRVVDAIIKRQAKRWGLRLYRYENVGNHLHILLRTKQRRQLAGFLRSISGLIARFLLGAERGTFKGIKFWDARPFSRIVQWGKEYLLVQSYFDKNRLQAIGFGRLELTSRE